MYSSLLEHCDTPQATVTPTRPGHPYRTLPVPHFSGFARCGLYLRLPFRTDPSTSVTDRSRATWAGDHESHNAVKPGSSTSSTTQPRPSVATKRRTMNYNLSYDFPLISRPNLALRPVLTGQARKMVQNTRNIGSGAPPLSSVTVPRPPGLHERKLVSSASSHLALALRAKISSGDQF